MENLTISPIFLAVIFFAIAYLYSSVGLGGGSSYTALLAIFGASTIVIPVISLMLNVTVSSIGAIQFFRKGHGKFRLVLPFLLTSIPFAYIGGSLDLPKNVFLWILWATLILIALRIYLWEHVEFQLNLNRTQKIIFALFAGSVLGFVAGTVGIGGGIYLAPIVIIFGLGTAKQAAATGAIFTFSNASTGLFSRLFHQDLHFAMVDIAPLWIAVIFGGLLGSFMGASRYESKTIQKSLGLVIVIAVIFLCKKLILQLN